jgi:hypothetical protein
VTKSNEVKKAQIDQFEADFPPVREWEEPATGGKPEYALETDCVKRVITGKLAEDIRAKLGADPAAEVTVTERNHHGHYSTLTRDDDFDCLIECSGVSKELYSHWAEWNSLPTIIEWLTEPERAPVIPTEPVEVPEAYLWPKRQADLSEAFLAALQGLPVEDGKDQV